MNMALKEAKKAFKYDDVPVGCVIVKNNKVIAKAYNKKENKNQVSYRSSIYIDWEIPKFSEEFFKTLM
mgnify:CR=1 FL=1